MHKLLVPRQQIHDYIPDLSYNRIASDLKIFYLYLFFDQKQIGNEISNFPSRKLKIIFTFYIQAITMDYK